MFRFALAVCFLFLPFTFASGAGDDPAPLSASIFMLYGTPVQPLSLGQSNTDGLGVDFLAEFQPTRYAAFGLGYETATFYGSQAFTAGSLNLEGRLFPFAGMRLPYDPYISGEAGVNLASGSPSQWGGSTALKVGIGTKVQFVGPLFLDFAVESHWMGNSPDFFQYVDGRFGIDYAIGMQPSTPTTPTPVMTPTIALSVLPTAVRTPTVTPTPMTVSMTSTPTPVAVRRSPSPPPSASVLVVENTPTPSPNETGTHSRVKKLYLMGVKAFIAHKYSTAIADLKLAVSIKEKIPDYYYAESYATIGVIYQFYRPIPHHLKLALQNYKKAYVLDPDTPAVKKYYKKLKAKLEKGGTVSAAPRKKKREVRAEPTFTPVVIQSAAPTPKPVVSSTAKAQPTPASASPAKVPTQGPKDDAIDIDMGK